MLFPQEDTRQRSVKKQLPCSSLFFLCGGVDKHPFPAAIAARAGGHTTAFREPTAVLVFVIFVLVLTNTRFLRLLQLTQEDTRQRSAKKLLPCSSFSFGKFVDATAEFQRFSPTAHSLLYW
jgi:hypothetical protein